MKESAEKMAMTEAMLDFDSMAKDIVNAKTQDKKLKAMDRLYKRVQSQSKSRDMSIQKVKKEIADAKAKEAKAKEERTKRNIEMKKKFKEARKTPIKKSRGGMINGNDLVSSYYEKG
jgi:septal ring factor EnvC (AmiA/AmiB activator)